MLASLWLPIVLAAVALFFASFLSWMVLQLHKTDWVKLEREEEFLQAGRNMGLKPGNYMFPGCQSQAEMGTPEFKAKMEAGPRGVLTVFGNVSMGQNLGLTFVYFLVISLCVAYLATLGLPRGAEFRPVFRFVSTAGLLAFLPAIVQHSIWFKCRITGHIIESIAYAAILGAIFGGLWPR